MCLLFLDKVKLHPGSRAYKISRSARIGNIRIHGHYRASGMMKAVRTMYRKKPRYVHLNVKRTSVGKCYYVKKSVRGFIRWNEAIERACAYSPVHFALAQGGIQKCTLNLSFV